MAEAENQQGSDAEQREFALQRIYTKDISFETPNTPDIFLLEWKPEINMDLQSEHKQVADSLFEVTLFLTVTCKIGEKTAYLCEVKQSGIFGLVGFPADEFSHMLGSYCPNILFPYAREVITDLVTKGSFPQLVVAPVNFDALYQQHMDLHQGQQPSAPQ